MDVISLDLLRTLLTKHISEKQFLGGRVSVAKGILIKLLVFVGLVYMYVVTFYTPLWAHIEAETWLTPVVASRLYATTRCAAQTPKLVCVVLLQIRKSG